MFGYLQPDLPYLYLKDDKLYKSLYCGVCKSIGGTCGLMARMTLTYDIAFLSAIAHNIIGCDVEIKKGHCLLHWFKSRPIASRDELTDKLAAINVILAHYKVEDDVIDNNKGRIKRIFTARGYKKARKCYPEIDKAVEIGYNELRALEKNKDSVIDRVCEPFSQILENVSKITLGEFSTEYTEKLFYYVGKWIYLIDALDDFDKDLKKNCYNPFVCAFENKSAKELLQNNGADVSYIFGDIFNNIKENLEKIEFRFNKDLVVNILLRGIPAKTKSIIEGINK